jgi:hypothetical protein
MICHLQFLHIKLVDGETVQLHHVVLDPHHDAVIDGGLMQRVIGGVDFLVLAPVTGAVGIEAATLEDGLLFALEADPDALGELRACSKRAAQSG